MPFGQVPNDDEVPAYQPLLDRVAGTQPANQIAQPPASGGFVPPYYGVAAPQVSAAPPQAQAQPIQATPVQGQQQPAQPAVVLPTAPTAPDARMHEYEALIQQQNKDGQRSIVAPKWWERLAGAAVGFGAGYKGGAAEGVRVGSAVTQRGQIAADEDQQSRLAADGRAIDAFKTGRRLDTDAFENQVRGYDAGMKGAEFGRQQANDTRQQGNEDRSFNEKKTEFGVTSQREADALAETKRANQSREGQEGLRIGQESARNGETARHNKATENLEGQHIQADNAKNAGKPGDRKSLQDELVKRRETEYDTANKEFDKMAADAVTPEDKKNVEDLRAKKSVELQARWNDEFAHIDPDGQFSRPDAAPASQSAAPAAARPAAAPAQKPQAANSPALPPDKVRVKMADGSIKVGPRANLAKVLAMGGTELK